MTEPKEPYITAEPPCPAADLDWLREHNPVAYLYACCFKAAQDHADELAALLHDAGVTIAAMGELERKQRKESLMFKFLSPERSE